jgi:hypothetical protein
MERPIKYDRTSPHSSNYSDELKRLKTRDVPQNPPSSFTSELGNSRCVTRARSFFIHSRLGNQLLGLCEISRGNKIGPTRRYTERAADKRALVFNAFPRQREAPKDRSDSFSGEPGMKISELNRPIL